MPGTVLFFDVVAFEGHAGVGESEEGVDDLFGDLEVGFAGDVLAEGFVGGLLGVHFFFFIAGGGAEAGDADAGGEEFVEAEAAGVDEAVEGFAGVVREMFGVNDDVEAGAEAVAEEGVEVGSGAVEESAGAEKAVDVGDFGDGVVDVFEDFEGGDDVEVVGFEIVRVENAFVHADAFGAAYFDGFGGVFGAVNFPTSSFGGIEKEAHAAAYVEEFVGFAEGFEFVEQGVVTLDGEGGEEIVAAVGVGAVMGVEFIRGGDAAHEDEAARGAADHVVDFIAF